MHAEVDEVVWQIVELCLEMKESAALRKAVFRQECMANAVPGAWQAPTAGACALDDEEDEGSDAGAGAGF